MLNKKVSSIFEENPLINMKKLIIASTSTVHGGKYLDYILPVLQNHFSKN